MFGMGMGELVIIAIVALLALGPERLPGAAKKIGKTIRDLRRQTSQLKKTIEEDSQLGDAMKEIKQALRDDPFRDPPERPKPAKTKSVTKRDGKRSTDGEGAGGGDQPGSDEAAPAAADGSDATGGDATDGGDATGSTSATDSPSATDSAATDTDEPAVQAAAEAIPVEPRMINMSEFQKYVHMWGPAAAAEKYGTSLEEAEAAIEAVVSQAAASKRDADG